MQTRQHDVSKVHGIFVNAIHVWTNSAYVELWTFYWYIRLLTNTQKRSSAQRPVQGGGCVSGVFRGKDCAGVWGVLQGQRQWWLLVLCPRKPRTRVDLFPRVEHRCCSWLHGVLAQREQGDTPCVAAATGPAIERRPSPHLTPSSESALTTMRAFAVVAVLLLAGAMTATALDSLLPKTAEFAAKHKDALDKVCVALLVNESIPAASGLV